MPGSSSPAPTPDRVFSCQLCQQRKVKCDREYPCANCTRSQAQCVPSASGPSRPRRRRFPEKALLERIRHYENLLRRNRIEFEPLHSATPDAHGGAFERRGAFLQNDVIVKTEPEYDAKDLWHAMDPRAESESGEVAFNETDNDTEGSLREFSTNKMWQRMHRHTDHLLLGMRESDIDLDTLHPPQVQIFKLWQLYLDNVNPLLKVTHASLQSRIIDAISDMTNMSPVLEALMFSIYCVSASSLSDEECRSGFSSTRRELLAGYQFGCRQALINCEVLRSSERDCLTALFLYLVSTRPDSDPQSLYTMLGVAIRIAQRMAIHSESANARCTAIEAEMRRRLWWSLVLFDARVCELADYKAVMLVPSWDCKPPLNLNDFDLRPVMEAQLHSHRGSTEALFAVVRSEMGDFIRHCEFHLDFTSPVLKPVAKNVQIGPIPEGGELVSLERVLEDKYLKFCNPENPLHAMTIWTSRANLAKNRLLEHYSKNLTLTAQSSRVEQTDADLDAALVHTLSMLEYDTKLMTSPLTKAFLWHIRFYFPFVAYIHITQDLRRRPFGKLAKSSWEAMADNYDARFAGLSRDDDTFFARFAKMILQAWDSRQEVCSEPEESSDQPRLVSAVNYKLAQMTAPKTKGTDTETSSSAANRPTEPASVIMPVDSAHDTVYRNAGLADYPDMQYTMDIDLSLSDWTQMDWSMKYSSSL